MANSRLYIEDTETGERLLLAKSFGSGWSLWPAPEALSEWLDLRDTAASYGNASTAETCLRLVTENASEEAAKPEKTAAG